jgi:hypothetical protein
MNTNTAIHRKTEKLLRDKGYEPLRQFAPNKHQAIGNEMFEIWAKHGETLVVHFYKDENGVEIYSRIGGSTFADIDAKI